MNNFLNFKTVFKFNFFKIGNKVDFLNLIKVHV